MAKAPGTKKPAPAATTVVRGKTRPRAARDNESALLVLARQLRSWTDSVLGVAGAAADASLAVAKSMLAKPEQKAALAKAGSLLRSVREGAGLSIAEVSQAIDLKDPSLLELVEEGKIALPFEIILRLASILGRNDPVSFIMKLTRTYNPELWKTLEKLGVGRILVQAGREREFANIYRAHDVARRLSDQEFSDVLTFTNAAFKMALAFRAHEDKDRPVRATAEAGG
jgi:transcriptional regulator with XRE-family HTH domain